jgi:hypothetical protein
VSGPTKLLLLALFAVVDVALVMLVMGHVNADPPSTEIAPAATASASAPNESVDQNAFEFDPTGASVLDVANDGTLVLGRRGDCRDGSGSVQVSSNGGSSLRKTDSGLSEVLAARAASGGNLTVVGLDPDCNVLQVSSADGGSTWTPDFEPTLWYMSPDDVYKVVSPDGPTSPGCTVTSLAQVDDDFARVTCADGVVRGSGDGGDEWVLLGRLDNVRVATFTSATDGFALARFAGCAAQVFVTDDSAQSWEQRSCLTGDPAKAIAASDTALVAVVGDDPELFTSDDRGEKFTSP